MSRLAIKPIVLPSGTSCNIEDGKINLVKGDNIISIPFRSDFIDVKIENSNISLKEKEGVKILAALRGSLGTTWALLKKGVENIQAGAQASIKLFGIGYRAALVKAGKFSFLKISVGFSHPIFIFIPEKVSIKIEKETLMVTGPTQKIVSDFCALVRHEKQPTIYHGTGVLVNGEVINKKSGKKK